MFSSKRSAFLFFLALILAVAFTFDSILISVSASPIKKRDDGVNSDGLCYGTFTGEGTFYEIGMGACGQQNTDQDLVAALPVSMFGNSPNNNPNLNKNCFRNATVSHNGKSVTVTIVDICQGCKSGDLDLSPAAFCKLADPSEGRIPITYVLN
ncbi:14576_t:CDS:2 [Acaulospora morrowiae]|uniref:14576_t:CDS:1 n=1 Tax=Acaulospora morrowiae TaxID=94023 RepID=A0A9N9HHB7_9GLOM|nr:14576_t:CDS:2 [Acaulospora morrowiae]